MSMGKKKAEKMLKECLVLVTEDTVHVNHSEKCVVSIKCCKDSTDDLVANDPAFLKRMAKRLKALTHAIPFSLSADSTSFSLIHTFSQSLGEAYIYFPCRQ